jgi:hypothetical protein
MYYVIILIIITVIALELYSIIKKLNFKKKEKNNHVDDLLTDVNFDEYTVKEDKIIKLGPGKIFINDNQNIFINYYKDTIFMKAGIVYTFENPFEIEVLNISGKNILYYYKRI